MLSAEMYVMMAQVQSTVQLSVHAMHWLQINMIPPSSSLCSCMRTCLCAGAEQFAKLKEQLTRKLIANGLPPVCYIPLLKKLSQHEPNLSADLQVSEGSVY